MEHDRIVEKLSEYRDGALGATERAEVSRHVSECADCSGALADWDLLAKAFLRRSAAPTAFQTEAFTARVMSRLPVESEPFARLLSRWLAPALGLGLAALAFSFSPYARDAGLDPAASLISSGSDRAGATDWTSRSAASADDLASVDTEE
jgi:anti-sigma factor RsiW